MQNGKGSMEIIAKGVELDHLDLPAGTDGWEMWPDIRQVAQLLNKERGEVLKLVKKRALVKWKCPDAVFRYEPSQVRAILDEQAAIQQEFSGVSSNELAEWSMRHTEQVLKMSWDGVGQAMQSVRLENARLSKRCEELEEQRIKMFDSLEKLQTASHQREMEIMRERSAENRKDRLVQTLLDQAPSLLDQIKRSFGGVAGGGERAAAGLRLLESLSGTHIDALVHSKMLTDEQVSDLLTAVGKTPIVAKAASVTKGDDCPADVPSSERTPEDKKNRKKKASTST